MSRRSEPPPEDSDHNVCLIDLHPFVDQSLRAVPVQTRARVGLPPPHRQSTSQRWRVSAIQLLDGGHHGVAFRCDIARRNDDDTQ